MNNDLAYISLACALYNVAQTEAKDDGIVVVEEDAQSAYKIRYCMNKVNDRLLKLLRKHSSQYDTVDPLRRRLLDVAIQYGSDTIQPDYLATYILRFRFVRTKRKVCNDFKWIGQKGGSLLHLLDLLDNTLVSDRDEEMCDLAYSIANELE